MKLNIIQDIPDSLYNCKVYELHAILGGPTLIHLKGKNSKALFLSALLHGNETTSFYAVQKLINKYKDHELPRDLILFFGNTDAAQTGQRHFSNQPDYNRIWKEGSRPEHLMAQETLNYLSEQDLFASIDIHNNSGKNPYYGCINFIKPAWVELANMFSNKIVYFTEPSEVLSLALSKFAPAVTIEAGLPGLEEGIEEVFEYINKVFNLSGFSLEFNNADAEVFHTIGRIKVGGKAKIDFENCLTSKADLSFIKNIDERNFEFLPVGAEFGIIKDNNLINVIDNEGKSIFSNYFKIQDKKLITTQEFIPSMFTKDIFVMKEDCLGYIMERINLSV